MFEYCMITAGGRGERLMPLTREISKAMIDVNGISIISRLIRQIKPFIDNISVTVGHKGDKLSKLLIEEKVSAVYNTNLKAEHWWIFNTPMRYIDGAVVVFACDLIIDMDLEFVYNCYKDLNSPAWMFVPILPVDGVEGDYITGENGIITAIDRYNKTDIFASGIYVVNPCKINQLIGDAADTAQSLWPQLIEYKELCYSNFYPASWRTINTVEQLRAITNQSVKNLL